MARTKQKAMARAQPPKRKQPEAAPPKAGQEEGSVAAGVGYEQREKEQQDAGGGDVNKRRRTAAEGGEPQQVSEEEEGEEEYVFEWSRFAMVNDGVMDEVTRADTIPRCDEPVEEVLTKPGLALLNSLTGGTTGDSSTSVVAGSWYEDVEEGRARGEQVRLAFPESSVEARVYRAPSSSTDAQRDRFELTYLTTDDDLQYVFVVDKVERRFVFVGEYGGHPHAGTNDFTYENSNGSGPGLLPDSSVAPTPTNLLTAATQRFTEYCLHRF